MAGVGLGARASVWGRYGKTTSTNHMVTRLPRSPRVTRVWKESRGSLSFPSRLSLANSVTPKANKTSCFRHKISHVTLARSEYGSWHKQPRRIWGCTNVIFAKFSNRVSCRILGRASALNSNDSFPKKRINKITREKWMRGKAKCVYFGILIGKKWNDRRK